MQKSFYLFLFSFALFGSLTGLGIFVASSAPRSDLALDSNSLENESAFAKFHVSNLSSTSFASDEKIRELEAKMPRLQEDKPFYHWTKGEVGIRWTLQGSIDPGEMGFYNTPTGERQVYGAGLYLADNSTSSKTFGAIPLAFVMKKGTMIYTDEVGRSVFGRSLSNEEILELGQQVPFVRDLKNGAGWYVTYQSANTTGVEYAGRLGAKLDSDKIGSFQEFLPLYEAGTAGGRGNEYLENLFFLMKYLDGISFMAAMETNPGRPQDVFEPENFEHFKQAYKAYLPRISYDNGAVNFRATGSKAVIQDFGIASASGTFGDGKSSAAAWAKTQAEHVLPQMYRMIQGTSDPNSYRAEGIRAGGTDAGGTFYVSLINAGHLKMNPYIETNLEMAADKMGFNVSYSYPDALHFKQLKDKLSPELFNELSSADPSELMSNHSRRQELNRRIVHELLIELFTRYHGKEINYKDPTAVGFLDDLMSIHPFPDKNGRTARLYFDIAHEKSKNAPPMFPLGDLDLIMSREFLAENLESATPVQQEIMEDYLSEFLRAAHEHRSPDFAMLGKPFSERPHAKILKMFSTLGTLSKIEIRKSHLALIQQRKFDQVFNDWFGKNWEIADMSSVHEALTVFKDKPEIEKLILSEIFRPTFISGMSLRQQEALLKLVSQRKLGIQFLSLIAENSVPHVIASMVPLIQELMHENPAVTQDPVFQKIITIVARNSEVHDSFFSLMFTNPWAGGELGKVMRMEWLKSRAPGAVFPTRFMEILVGSHWIHNPDCVEFLTEVAKSGMTSILAGFSRVDSQFPSKFFETSSGMRLVQTLLEHTPPGDQIAALFLQNKISAVPETFKPVYRKMAMSRVLQGSTTQTDLDTVFGTAEMSELPVQMQVRRVYQIALEKKDKALARDMTETLFKHGMVGEQKFTWSILLGLMRTQDPELVELAWSRVRSLSFGFLESKASDQAFEFAFRYGNDNAKAYAALQLPKLIRAGEDPDGPRFTKIFDLLKSSSPRVQTELFSLLGQSAFIHSAKATAMMSVLLDPGLSKRPELQGNELDGVLRKLARLAEVKDKDVSAFILKLASVRPDLYAPSLFEASLLQTRENLDLFLRLGELALQSSNPDVRRKTYDTFSQFMTSPVRASNDQIFSFLERALKHSDFEAFFINSVGAWQPARVLAISWSEPRYAQLMAKVISKMQAPAKAKILMEDDSAVRSQVGSNLLAEFILSDDFSRHPSFLNDLNSLRTNYRKELPESPYYPRILRAISLSKVPGIRTQFERDIQKYGVASLSCEEIFVGH